MLASMRFKSLEVDSLASISNHFLGSLRRLTFELLGLQKRLEHLAELLMHEWFGGIVLGTVRARASLVDLGVVAGDVEQRVP
jgi:hypothetical protein